MPIGTPYNVGSTAPNGTAATTVAIVTTVDVQPNDRIIVSVGDGDVMNLGVGADSATDTAGNVYELDAWVMDNASPATVTTIFSAYAYSGLASGSTITITYAASTKARSAAAVACSGLIHVNAVDITGGGNRKDILIPAWRTQDVNTSHPDVLIWAAATASANGTISSTIDVPSVEVHDMAALTSSPYYAVLTTAYRIESTFGTYAVGGTWSVLGPSGAPALVAYKDTTPTDPHSDTVWSKP